MLVRSVDTHAKIVSCCRRIDHNINFGHGLLNLANAVHIFLRTVHKLHQFWSQKTLFSSSDRQEYFEQVVLFGKLWEPLGWKVSTWVHWVARHSHAIADLHLNFYVFSSIPTERRNVEFKLDVTHCFKGWKLSRPYASLFGFGHELNLSALDVGLALYKAGKRAVKHSSDDE